MDRVKHFIVRLSQALASLCVGLVLAAPAHAAGTTALPDPGGLTLFSLGLAGLIFGRRIAARKRDDD
jgi:hypothetical protein